jgi:hypothetical protein
MNWSAPVLANFDALSHSASAHQRGGAEARDRAGQLRRGVDTGGAARFVRERFQQRADHRRGVRPAAADALAARVEEVLQRARKAA